MTRQNESGGADGKSSVSRRHERRIETRSKSPNQEVPCFREMKKTHT